MSVSGTKLLFCNYLTYRMKTRIIATMFCSQEDRRINTQKFWSRIELVKVRGTKLSYRLVISSIKFWLLSKSTNQARPGRGGKMEPCSDWTS